MLPLFPLLLPAEDVDLLHAKVNGLDVLVMLSLSYTATRIGPNRVAADLEGNGEFDFGVNFRIFGEFLRNFVEIIVVHC